MNNLRTKGNSRDERLPKPKNSSTGQLYTVTARKMWKRQYLKKLVWLSGKLCNSCSVLN